MPDAPSSALPPGHRLAEYEIVRVLGAGGFGITYLAFDHRLDGPVAIKEYFPADLATRGDAWSVSATATTKRDLFAWGLDRFLDEARAIHRFRHPNVVRANRYLEANGTAYIVMEYVEGESLKAILDRRGRLSAGKWRPWIEALLEGLAHVHAHDYLHRDIKPANIVVRAEDGEPVLIDFGSARVQHRGRTHTQVLTAGYAPIEQYSAGATQGPPADIYALAAVSYRVLTGSAAPSAPDRVLSDDYEPLADRVLDADAGWLAALDRGLAVRPEDRPPDVNAWSKALGTATHSGTSSASRNRWETAENGEPNPGRRGAVNRLRAIIGRPLASFRSTLGESLFEWTENYARAEAWFRKAADLDHPHAQAWLGWLYVDGAFPFSRDLTRLSGESLPSRQGTARLSEVAKDEAQAAGWFRKAATQGHTGAQLSLAMMYAAGVGVEQDYSQAERWCRRAAERGDPWAQNVLGIVHAVGTGPLKDAAKAEEWLRRAASAGRLPRRQSHLRRRRRHEGLSIARFNLGCFYATVREQRDADAARWLRDAAEQGVNDAQNALGVMHAAGRGVPRDDAEAEKWFTKAAEDGLAVAQYNLGAVCAERGDDAEARSWFRRSTEESDPLAQSALGFLYAEGRTYRGERRRENRRALSESRSVRADSFLYLTDGREDDLKEAESWYRKAVESWAAFSREGGSTLTCPSATWRLRGPRLYPFPQRWSHRSFFGDRFTNAQPSANWRVPVQNGWGFVYVGGSALETGEFGPLGWFLKGAEKGHAAAQHSLGRLYRHGWGVPQDEFESLTWFRLSAKQGSAEAQADLGEMYEIGEGVPQDYGEALKWYRRAAKRGHARATRLLGRLYETGAGVPVDKVAAARRYSVAAKRGDRAAVADLNRLTSEGWKEPVVADQSKVEIDEVEWLQWCRRAAEAGHAEAQASLGSAYANGYTAPLDHAKAMVWYRKAAEQGCVNGQVGLAGMYEGGYKATLDERETETGSFSLTEPSPEDLAEAADWYRKAAGQEDAEAEAALGWMYRNGSGVPKDEVEAVKWYRRAACQGTAALSWRWGPPTRTAEAYPETMERRMRGSVLTTTPPTMNFRNGHLPASTPRRSVTGRVAWPRSTARTTCDRSLGEGVPNDCRPTPWAELPVPRSRRPGIEFRRFVTPARGYTHNLFPPTPLLSI